ncbi:unnamed protein product (macronuclear) [Paramecium tetraurelia]|uniref:Anaphase-promoting complex subunit 4 WD40 domain-containing protein n=1 Tax=Paramecium tetraurelia TaxID=5888 RepID=A0CWT8_PARTE|nr:uncharacterized protein GSPATT00001458001 [Paramecium tetraurelia]CAK75255.1 unnamed protein product [Paramecium tetraurelia]|eukprot:XP_001442652.1 hypothetical protein (macronuclear) [Paramecium tetraurelia strain d4-2]
MPELFIPVYFGSFDFQNHFITAWADDLDKKRIATGSINGDIIIWEFDNFILKPLIKSTPHLIYRVGGVTALQIMRRPFAEFQDSNMNCAIAIHQDKRIRILSMLDGKQILISDHDQFPYTKQITQIYPIGDRTSRYISCFGEGTALYIYDLWKMCCSKIFQIQDEFDQPRFTIFTSIGADFAVIDSKCRVYKIDTSAYKKTERQNYLKYIEKKAQEKKKNGIKKSLIRMSSSFSLKGLPQSKIINTVYNTKSQIMYIVYSKSIYVVNSPFKETEQQREMFSIQSSTNLIKFRNVHLFKSQNKTMIVIEQLNGHTSFIYEKDIQDIISLISKSYNQCITLDFNGFSFSKQSQSYQGQLLLLVNQQLTPIQVSKYFFQKIIYTINNLLFRQNGCIIEIYIPDSINYEDFRICSLQQDNLFDIKLLSEGFMLFLHSQSRFINENKQFEIADLPKKLIDLSIFEQNDILKSLNENLPIEIQEQLNQIQNISIYTIGLYNKTDLFAIFGTEQGQIFLIPFFYEKNKRWNIYVNKEFEKNIIFLKFIKNSIFAVDQTLKLKVFSLSSIFGKFDNQSADFFSTYQTILPSNIKQVIQIRQLFQESSNSTFSNNDALIVKRKLAKHFVALLLEDDSIVIYHTILNVKKFSFHNQFKINKGQVKLYYVPHLLIFLFSKGVEVSVWSMEKGSFERMINIQQLQEYLNIDTLLTQKLSQMINLYDFKSFKTDQVSQFDLLEYSNRSYQIQYNYSQELKQTSPQYFYDFFGTLNKIQQNTFEFDEILHILSYEDQAISYRNKSITIFEPQEMGDMFLLYKIYLKQFKSTLQFDRVNKLYKQQKEQRRLDSSSSYYLIWFDCKKNIELIKYSMENTASLKIPFTYVHFYHTLNLVPIFKCQFGLQGMAEGFSRLIQSNNYQISGLMSTQYSIAAALCLRQIKSRFQISEINNSTSLLSLSRYSLDNSKDIIEISCQLISQQIKKMDSFCNDIVVLQRTSKEFLQLFERSSSNVYFSLEIMCLIIQTYLMQQMMSNIEMINYVFNRIMSGFTHQLCLKKPNIVFVFIKLLEDGMKNFHKCIQQPKVCLQTLIQIYYYIYTTYKHGFSLKEIINATINKKSKDKDKDKYEILRQYQSMSQLDLQRIKQRLRILIMALSEYFFEDFKGTIKEMINQTDIYPIIACSILDLLHCLSKTDIKPNEILFILDLSIKSIDQNNQQLRRYTYKTFVKLVQYLDQRFEFISFSQKKLKLAFAFEGLVQIYDLRYGVKLQPLDRYQSQITSIAFDSKGNQLASFSQKDQNLKIFQLKPTSSFLQGYENVYIKLTHQFNFLQPLHHTVEWDKDCEYIYLQHEDESQVFKID